MIKYSKIGTMNLITLKLDKTFSEQRLSAIISQTFSYLETCVNGAIIADCRNTRFDLNDLGKYRLMNQIRRYQRVHEVKCVIMVSTTMLSSCDLKILNNINRSEKMNIAISKDFINALQWLGIKIPQNDNNLLSLFATENV